MNHIPLSITLLLALTLSRPVVAADKECTQLEAYAAETVTDYLDSWGNVYTFFKQFRHCYDGAIAEGAQDRIYVLWSRQWHRLPTMISLAQRDPEFKDFLWQTLASETFPQDEFSIVVQNTRRKCPSEAREFCRAVLKEAKRQ